MYLVVWFRLAWSQHFWWTFGVTVWIVTVLPSDLPASLVCPLQPLEKYPDLKQCSHWSPVACSWQTLPPLWTLVLTCQFVLLFRISTISSLSCLTVYRALCLLTDGAFWLLGFTTSADCSWIPTLASAAPLKTVTAFPLNSMALKRNFFWRLTTILCNVY